MKTTLWTVGDAARECGVSPETVRLWERLGKLPAQRTESGMRLFAAEDVVRFKRERAQRAKDVARAKRERMGAER